MNGKALKNSIQNLLRELSRKAFEYAGDTLLQMSIERLCPGKAIYFSLSKYRPYNNHSPGLATL